MELALKQTYQDTCNCIKSPIKLEFEKRQQVNYQSCITFYNFLSCDLLAGLWLELKDLPKLRYSMKEQYI